MELSTITEPPPYTPVAMPISMIATGPCLPSYREDSISTRDTTNVHPASPPGYEECTHISDITPPPSYEYTTENIHHHTYEHSDQRRAQDVTSQHGTSHFVS